MRIKRSNSDIRAEFPLNYYNLSDEMKIGLNYGIPEPLTSPRPKLMHTSKQKPAKFNSFNTFSPLKLDRKILEA